VQWTADAVEDLKRLALEGRSASFIAATLGVTSRNAVIGKANRVGIKLSGGGRSAQVGVGRARRAEWSALQPSSRASDKGCPALAYPQDAAWALGEAEVGEMRRVSFEEIREFACRWPLGDPRSGEFAFCGLAPAKGESYCAGHCRMAYRAPNAGVRRRTQQRQTPHASSNTWRLF